MRASWRRARARLCRHRRSLSSALVVALLLATLHLLAAAGTRQLKARAEQAALTSVSLRTEAAEQMIIRMMEGYEVYFDLLETRRQLRLEGTESAQVIADSIERRIQGLAQSKRFGVFQVMVLDRDGVGRWTSAGGEISLPMADLPSYATHSKVETGVLFVGPLVGRHSGRDQIVISRRLPSQGSEYMGVGLLAVDTAELRAVLAGFSGSRINENATLYRNDGQRLVANYFGRAGQDAAHDTTLIPHLGTVVARRVTATVGGEDRFVANRMLNGLPLIVGISRPAADELAEFENLRKSLLLGELLAALVILAGGFSYAWPLGRRAAIRSIGALKQQRAELERVLDGIGGGVVLLLLGSDGQLVFNYASAGARRLASEMQRGDGHAISRGIPPAAHGRRICPGLPGPAERPAGHRA